VKAHIVIDCEASGPCPGFGDMISFGAIVVEPALDRGFRSPTIAPTCDAYDDGAYASIQMTREQHIAKSTAALGDAMGDFDDWLTQLAADRLIFWSDNPAFDWQWIHHGFQVAGRRNPFGHSGRRIGDLYAGLSGNAANVSGWKKRRQTAHDHDPLNDAKGNAEALLSILSQYDQLKALSIPVGTAAKQMGVA